MNRAKIALFLHLATDVGNGTLVFNLWRYVFPARRQSVPSETRRDVSRAQGFVPRAASRASRSKPRTRPSSQRRA